MLIFLGLHSSLIHFVSSLSWSSPELSSTTYLSMFFAIRIPTPPPSFSFLFFPIHLYPLIFTFCFSFSLVSVISAIWIFSDSSSDSRLFIFPFSPLTLIVAMVRFLFFLIFVLLRFFFSWFCALSFSSISLSVSSAVCVLCCPRDISVDFSWFFPVFSWSSNVCTVIVRNVTFFFFFSFFFFVVFPGLFFHCAGLPFTFTYFFLISFTSAIIFLIISCSWSLSPSFSWLLLRFLSWLAWSRGQLSSSCQCFWLVEGLGFHCLLSSLWVPLSGPLGVLGDTSIGCSCECRNWHCLSILQYPFR